MPLLRLHIDGEWKAAEFASFFKELHDLYQSASFTYRVVARAPEEHDEVFLRMSRAARPIEVRKIAYGSRGFTDLAGLGVLVRELREFVQFLIVHFREREDRKLDREERRIAIAGARLGLLIQLRKQRELSRSGEEEVLLEHFSKVAEFAELPSIDEIAEAIFDNRLLGAEVLDDTDLD